MVPLFVFLVVIGQSTVGQCDDPNAVDAAAIARLQAPPLGLPVVPRSNDNPITEKKIELGRKLFFDRRLSKNGTMSCGMCHIPEQGFTNNELSTPVGVNGKSVRRNAPTVLNAAYLRQLFHDGRQDSLEKQVVLPLFAHDEMGNTSVEDFVSDLSKLTDYSGLFKEAFGGGPTIERVARAIASWERTLLAADSPFDRWYYAGQSHAMNALQKRGWQLFVGKAGCAKCHSLGASNALFTDQAFHNTGIGYLRENGDDSVPIAIEIAPHVVVRAEREIVSEVAATRQNDLGRYEVTKIARDKWRYRTPSLRNVGVTAPYMHDGSVSSLKDVVRYYNAGGVPHPELDPLLKPLGLDEDEIDSLVAFLDSLTAGNLPELQADARTVVVGN